MNEGLKNVFKKLMVPERLIPSRLSESLDATLFSGNIPLSAREWISIWLGLGVILFLIGLAFKFLYGAALFSACIVALLILPGMQEGRIKAKIEEPLPDALHQMSVSMRTGLVIESVIKEISEGDYGPLSEEFLKITVEMKSGRTLRNALLAFADRTNSKQIDRAVTLIVEGIESGGAISEVLEEVSDDIRSVRTIQRERKTFTAQQISFLAMASLIAGPFVMGVVASLPSLLGGNIPGGAEYPMDDINSVISALSFYVAAQGISAGVMMGVVMYGDMKKGLKLSIPLAIVAYIVYTIIRIVMPSAMAAF